MSNSNASRIRGERDWRDIAYLLEGTSRQRQAYQALQSLAIFSLLADYTPILAGTIPLNLDVEGSDLDVICEVHDPAPFIQRLTSTFGHYPGFDVVIKEVAGLPSVIANFTEGDFPIQIFGQPRPAVEQNAFRHMIVEARLLAIGGDDAHAEIRRLKRGGLKTEPAFARYFKLSGEPYEELLRLSRLDDQALLAAIRVGSR